MRNVKNVDTSGVYTDIRLFMRSDLDASLELSPDSGKTSLLQKQYGGHEKGQSQAAKHEDLSTALGACDDPCLVQCILTISLSGSEAALLVPMK